MGLFHKKEKVPELPLANSSGAIKEPPKKETFGLPSVPKNLGANLNREIVKSAVADNETGMQESVLETPEGKQIPEESLIPSVPTQPIKAAPRMTLPSEEKPLFVRIDQFQEAKTDLKEIDKKIKVIESSLKKFNEIKMREDTEISALNKELNFVKEKISQVDTNIFEKI